MIKLLTISAFFILLQGRAADAKYLFYHVNKDVQWQHDGVKEKAQRGKFLSANQSIIITELADVMLVQSDGKSMLLEKPGSYSYLQIKKLFNAAKTNSTSSGFFSYVFDKFLNGGSSDDKQRVSAAVIRGKYAMYLPGDSSFLFTTSILLQWKPEQKNIPYRIIIRINEKRLDTVIRQKTSFTVPATILDGNKAMLLQWTAVPSDSKQKQPNPFLSIIPAEKDKRILQQQLKHLMKDSSKDPQLMRLMKNDLFERWLELYRMH